METKTQTPVKLETRVDPNVIVRNGSPELKDRLIGDYQCTIARNHDGVDERTYEMIDGELRYVQGGLNHIPQNHPRYQELSAKLAKAFVYTPRGKVPVASFDNTNLDLEVLKIDGFDRCKLDEHEIFDLYLSFDTPRTEQRKVRPGTPYEMTFAYDIELSGKNLVSDLQLDMGFERPAFDADLHQLKGKQVSVYFDKTHHVRAISPLPINSNGNENGK